MEGRRKPRANLVEDIGHTFGLVKLKTEPALANGRFETKDSDSDRLPETHFICKNSCSTAVLIYSSRDV